MIGGAVGALLSFSAGLSGLVLLGVILTSLLLGWALAKWLDCGVGAGLLSCYSRWLMPGETAVIVRVEAEKCYRAFSMLRRSGAGRKAAVFFLRSEEAGYQSARRAARLAETFTPERLRMYAGSLAASQKVSLKGRRRALLGQLRVCRKMLEEFSRTISLSVRMEQSLTAGAEWFLDNAYLIQGQIDEILRNLPKNYYEGLPILAGGPYEGYSRVYAIATELIDHVDARLDRENILDFLQAYQDISPLKTGELWAMPLMLRLGLIEKLQWLSAVVDRRQRDQEQADFWAHRLLAASRLDPDHLLSMLAELARELPNPTAYLATRLVGQLHDDAAALASLQTWLERKFDQGLAEIIQDEQTRQTADQISVGNAVSSLRYLSRLDWDDLFEKLSLVEEILRQDPSGVYPRMDFATRDHYRHVLEEVARRARLPEIRVAQTVVGLARDAQDSGSLRHVGYYLIAGGRRKLERSIHARLPLRESIPELIRSHPTPIYLGAIVLGTLAFLAGLAFAVRSVAPSGLAVVLVLSVLPASELAIQVVNYLVARFLPPSTLPKMSFKQGIPDEYRTLVAVPMMLLTPEAVRGEVERLEIRYLANTDENIRYALLSDFADAPASSMPEDEVLFRTAVEGIEDLNARYGAGRFLLICRPRRWSESERRWIGWERKRGKIEMLNRLLIEGPGDDNDLSVAAGDQAALAGVRYVITLDADTQLPRDTARRLIETIAHPLNRPRLSPDGRRVVSGYTVIQPRVSTSLPSATASYFSRIFSDATGTDPYARAISDVYQDMFGAGTFYGKGLYDVETFHRVLSGRFPQATILSHDLLEGAYLRTGLASEIELFDLFPSSYQAYVRRQHRWTRGDWQITNWIGLRVPKGSQRESNPLCLIDRWKILDNLRRSLLPPFSIAFLGVSWIVWPAGLPAGILVAAVLFFPVLADVINRLLSGGSNNAITRRDLATGLARGVFTLSLYPHQALLAMDAITRTIYRRLISRRRLLEWETAQMAHWRCNTDDRGRTFNLRMAGASIFALALAALILVRNPGSWKTAAPFLSLWFLSPLAARMLDGRRILRRARPLTAAERGSLRLFARLTWRFFDDFVSPETHWLPPDNYQEALHVELAQRTSPTNIGLWLVSILAALDLGYLTPDQALARITATEDTLGRLDLYEGHLFNWYDLRTLEPLRPRYVSTVDSGNLLAGLLTLIQGCREMAEKPLLGPETLAGLNDNLALLRESLQASGCLQRYGRQLQAISGLLSQEPAGLGDFVGVMLSLQKPASELSQDMAASQPDDPDCLYWAVNLSGTIGAWGDLIGRYLSWAGALNEIKESGDLSDLDEELHAAVERALREAPSLRYLAASELLAALEKIRTDKAPPQTRAKLEDVKKRLGRAASAAREQLGQVESALAAAGRLSDAMNMRILYDPERHLFSIGYDVSERRLDTSYYDLLASEARLASYVAIARGEVPNENWISLGRPFGKAGDQPVLMSWNGSMFEYLMPLLFNLSFPNSLLECTSELAVIRQISYARKRGIPWGISEAAFSALDAEQTYRYRAFGVPGLGLKRGLEDDLVVAPYATALALMIDPVASIVNFKELAKLGLKGRFGFYEAIDFTRQRRPEGERGVIVYCYMAHHQGMSLVAIDNTLHRAIMRSRLHADPRIRAAEPLLFERIPVEPPVSIPPEGKGPTPRLTPIVEEHRTGRLTTPNTPTPKTLLLANGSYNLMITNAGGGYSRWRDYDLVRWRADATRDAWGSFIYLRDLGDGTVWSATYQPTCTTGRRYTATFAAERAEFRRRDLGIETVTEVVISPEDDAEIRLVTLINRSARRRTLELTSYVELALAPHETDRAHQAYNKIFIETEALPALGALLAWRRQRTPEEKQIWAAHVLAPSQAVDAPLEYETDRSRFIGRTRNAGNPIAMTGPLTGTTGAVLDPIFSLRCRVKLNPGERTRLAFVTVAADNRPEIMALVDKYRDPAAAAAAMEKAWTRSQLELRHYGIQADEAATFQVLASQVLFPDPRLRPPWERLRRSSQSRSRLWSHGISGDLPIVAVTVDDANGAPMVREALLAHTYLRTKGFLFDLVILNEEAASYLQPLHEDLKKLVQAHSLLTGIDRPGGVFLRATRQMSEDDLNALLSTARVVLVAARGPLAQQLNAPLEQIEMPPRLKAGKRPAEEPSPPLPFMELPYFNGLGGFTQDGKEYAIYMGPGTITPAPWINVLANPDFGALVSESGQGMIWYGNSQTNRLTPWSNDPVSDPISDAVYLRDEESGLFWTPTPLPMREDYAYRTRHGQGYTVVEHNSHGIAQELDTYVPMDENGGAPVRVQILRLRNQSDRRRRISVFSYAAWTLGTDREETQLHVVTKWDSERQILLARNTYHPEFARRVAFTASSPAALRYTSDRMEFLGRNGSTAVPAALERQQLSGRIGGELDPCSALQVEVALDPGQPVTMVFLLGQGSDIDEVHRLVERYRDPFSAEEGLARTKAWWNRMLSTIQVHTPDLAADMLLNRWLLYQTLACRVWARSGFYQSSGAYGFRDQLQDITALLHACPLLSRAHLLKAASRQFLEGDVQHWWHPENGSGVRTRCSDDLLWLVYATARYVQVTGDTDILEERVPFLEGRSLEEGEQEAFLVPSISMEDGSIFEHCRRAVDRSLSMGPHELPRIGCGDWNDAMNRVGIAGRGESVWMAWFLADVLESFADICERRGQEELAEDYRHRRKGILEAVERRAWDGDWYYRALCDDGQPIGAARCQEARIDSLPQSWAVISGAGEPDRARHALKEAENQLVRWEDQLVLLFTPPFDRSPLEPGYIKGYPPGVRENGGQYTHAAVWFAMAFARLGDGAKAVSLLRLLNPVEHARTPAEAERYKVEPYVLAADVYALPGRTGQGGWTWYTGSSGWMYRVWLEEVLGFHRSGDSLIVDPVIPPGWPGFDLEYRHGTAAYAISVDNSAGTGHGVVEVELDGVSLPAKSIPLVDDAGNHAVRIRLGNGRPLEDAAPAAAEEAGVAR